MVAVEGLEEQDLVAGIEQRHGGGVIAGGSPEATRTSRLGVVVEAVVALLLCGDGLAQAGDAVAAGVDVVAGADGLDGSASTAAGTGVSQTPWARLMPPMRSHSVVMSQAVVLFPR